MNRAMYSGVAGLKTHQTRMDVIGNNIANVNTVGYKSQSALFSDLLYQNSSNASGPNSATGLGGINAKQVGLGAKMASISTNITLPGSAETTNNPFDIRITGQSFFVVNNGRDNLFTRDGSFKVDAAGNLVMSSNGYRVMGWLPDPDNPTTIKPDTVTALQIMNAANMTYPAEATTQGYISGIIDEQSPEVNSEDGKVMNLNFYDARGYSYTAKLALKKAADTENNHVYTCELVKLLDASGKDITEEAGAMLGVNQQVGLAEPQEKTLANDSYTLTPNGGGYELRHVTNDPANGAYTTYTITDGAVTGQKYNADGSVNGDALSEEEAWAGVAAAFGYEADEFQNLVCTVTTGNPPTGTEYKVSKQLATLLLAEGMNGSGEAAGSLHVTGRYMDGVTVNFSKEDGSFVSLGTGNSTATLNFTGTESASFSPIEIDFSALSNQGNNKVTTASATNGSLADASIGAGRMVGKMSGLSIQNDGKIYATYDNGQSKLLAQIAVARFANAAGLEKAGDNLYTSTQNSGDFDGIGVDITSDGGYMTPGELEMSNVDLSGELTNMIVTQRGFQANSRIITVSDTMLEELVNLKR